MISGRIRPALDDESGPVSAHTSWFDRQRGWGAPILTAAALVGLGVLALLSFRSSLSDDTSSGRSGATAKAASKQSPAERINRDATSKDEKTERPQAQRASSATSSSTAAWLDRPSPKSVQVGKAGSVDQGIAVLLVHKAKTDSGGTEEWQRMDVDAPVFTADQLMALPGFRANLVLDKGVDVYLWGSVPYFLLPNSVLETAVILNDSSGYDLDLTLVRGRVILTSRKESALVRLRLYQEKEGTQVWNITLHEGAEVGLEKMAEPAADFVSLSEKTAPMTVFSLVALKGEADVRVEESRELSVSADGQGSSRSLPGQIRWENRSGRITTLVPDPSQRKDWEKALPANKVAETMASALRDLDQRSRKTDLRTAVREAVDDAGPASRILGIDCLGALDDVPGLLDVLGSFNEDQAENSVAAFVTLQGWLSRDGRQDRLVYDALLKRKLGEDDAQTVLRLLHGFSDQRSRDPATWEWLVRLLEHPNPMICYLAYQHLYQKVPAGREIPYSPRASAEQKTAAKAAWKKVIPDGSLPPELR
jgi:hypothetical protein